MDAKASGDRLNFFRYRMATREADMANYKKVVGTGKKLLSRVAGFSFMGVGVSWKAPEEAQRLDSFA